MNKGDIVLVPFPFTDMSGVKVRPALVLMTSDADLTLCFITSKQTTSDELDVEVAPSKQNGLKFTSVIRTFKLATISMDIAVGLLGRIAIDEHAEVLMKIARRMEIYQQTA
ncbi:MAG: type II toxin-antitoxin system PemK/MazF family toxin [Flavobacteriales bacterium]